MAAFILLGYFRFLRLINKIENDKVFEMAAAVIARRLERSLKSEAERKALKLKFKCPPEWSVDAEYDRPYKAFCEEVKEILNVSGEENECRGLVYLIRLYDPSSGGHILKFGYTTAYSLYNRFTTHSKDFETVGDFGFLVLAVARVDSEKVEKDIHTRLKKRILVGHTRKGADDGAVRTEIYPVGEYHTLIDAIASHGGVRGETWVADPYSQKRDGREFWEGKLLKTRDPVANKYNLLALREFYSI